MNNEKQIPTLNPTEMLGFHFHSIEWKSRIILDKHPFFHINRLENIIGQLKFPLPPHRKTVHDFIFLTKGSSKRSKGLDNYDFSAGDLFFLPAYQITEHHYMSTDAEGFFCQFDERLFHFIHQGFLRELLVFFKADTNPTLSLSEANRAVMLPIFERLLSLYEDEERFNIDLITSHLQALLLEMQRDIQPLSKKTKMASLHVVEQYKKALTEHIYQYQSVLDYADRLHISADYLNKCVKKNEGKTAQQLLNEMLILEAKTLLKYSNLQVAEIAVKLCDQSPSNFTRFFKHHTGLTPKEFIEKS